MPTYDSLLLNCGGGIINHRQQSRQYCGAAALAIGIGGTGVAALAELKRKVYQQLEPDNPDSPIPTYQHIQFLAIDSDESEIASMRGPARLDKDKEFFSINNPNLQAALMAKDQIKKNPSMNWMDIDKINTLLSTQGAGGVRQVGRYLLISRASSLKQTIEAKCNLALQKAGTPYLDVYIFAGISGGTGSGCFLDTCYIAQKALDDMGKLVSTNIMGFFFLPDVVISKPQVAADPTKVSYNSSNGYAAMKELDYLMGLKPGNDWFRQNYGPFRVDTQEPPVKMCHLISATKADGSVLQDGFQYCINVAADYVMAYLADVQLPAAAGAAGGQSQANQTGLTMRGHLANVNNGVSGLSRMHGANPSYHILGAANAEIPMTQISTYLAAGFMRRFREQAGKEQLDLKLPKSVVNDWVQDIGLTAQQVYNEVVNGCPNLMLPDIDYEDLRSYGTMPAGRLPEPWATTGNAWCDASDGKRQTNRSALEGRLPSFLYSNVTDDSLIGRTFRKLYDISRDPQYGPYYAARLLSCDGYDLKAAVDGAIREMEENRKTQQMYLNDIADRAVRASATFCSKHFLGIGEKSAYTNYINAAREHYRVYNRMNECRDVVITLQRFREQLDELSSQYFALLSEVLDNLQETFQADEAWLGTPEAKAPTAYTTRILQLSDIRPHLDQAINALNAKQLVQDFLEYLMRDPDQWRTRDDGRIGLYISEFMVENLFKDEVNRSLEDYLYEKYPKAGHNPTLLAQEVNKNILGSVYKNAVPMFWCNPTFNLGNPNTTFDSSSLSVPANAAAICSAAQNFGQAHKEFYIRRTGLKDRIFALRFCSGIPFYAYQGVTQLKGAYDAGATAQYGVGAHLYSRTERGQDDSGFHDWRSFLPVPMPYSNNASLVDHAQESLALYDEGVANGIIYQNGTDYFIRKSAPVDVPSYDKSTFVDHGELNANSLYQEKARLENLLETMYAPENGAEDIPLKNDGYAPGGSNVVTRVRKDYFLHYPMLQQVVREELEKQRTIRQAIARLDSIEAEYNRYEADLTAFANMLFYGLIKSVNATGKADYLNIGRAFYKYRDKRGMETEKVFVENSKAFPFCKKYPLFEMFRTYQSIGPKEEPRQEMEKKEAELRKQLRGPNDHLIAAKLELMWNADELRQLEDKTAGEKPDDRESICRFYEGLVNRIRGYRDLFDHDQWTRDEPVKENSSSGAAVSASEAPAPSAPMPPRTWIVSPGGTTQYTVYSDRSLQMAWDANNNAWVNLTPSMWVLNKNGDGWEAIRLDDAGNIMN